MTPAPMRTPARRSRRLRACRSSSANPVRGTASSATSPPYLLPAPALWRLRGALAHQRAAQVPQPLAITLALVAGPEQVMRRTFSPVVPEPPGRSMSLGRRPEPHDRVGAGIEVADDRAHERAKQRQRILNAF